MNFQELSDRINKKVGEAWFNFDENRMWVIGSEGVDYDVLLTNDNHYILSFTGGNECFETEDELINRLFELYMFDNGQI